MWLRYYVFTPRRHESENDMMTLTESKTCDYCNEPNVLDEFGESTNLQLLDPFSASKAMMCCNDEDCDARTGFIAATPLWELQDK